MFLLFTALIVRAQDPVYSQFYAAPMQLNPAFAGNVETGSVSAVYRNQWPSIEKAYRTYSLSASKFYPNLNSGFGLHLTTDDAGDGLYTTTSVDLAYAYRLRIKSGHYLKMALQAGYGESRVDWNRLVFFDQIDPRFGAVSPGGIPFPTNELQPVDDKSSYVDIGAGLLYFNPAFYAGLTLHHLNTPNDNFLTEVSGENTGDVQGLPLRWSLHAGAQINIGRQSNRIANTWFMPHFLMVRQKDFMQIGLGGHLQYRSFALGLSYRHAGQNPDAVIASTYFTAGAYKIGYSYDVTVSELSVPSGGAHEISFNVNFDKFPWTKKKSPYNDCLELFR